MALNSINQSRIRPCIILANLTCHTKCVESFIFLKKKRKKENIWLDNQWESLDTYTGELQAWKYSYTYLKLHHRFLGWVFLPCCYVWTNNLDVDHSGNVIQNHVACAAKGSEGENISFLSNTKQSSQLCLSKQHYCL